jgi:uncharacterized membrane protein YkvA (DUF1232 family)
MSVNSPKRPISWNLNAIVRDMVTAWRLIWNPAVPTALKLILPAAALLYWVFPLDLLPGLPFDDIAILILALRFFVQLAPDITVEQTKSDARRRANGLDDENTIDTTWRVVDDKGNP